jgi:hypothetical protein
MCLAVEADIDVFLVNRCCFFPGVLAMARVSAVCAFPIAAGVSKILGYLLLLESMLVCVPAIVGLSTVVGFPHVACIHAVANCSAVAGALLLL